MIRSRLLACSFSLCSILLVTLAPRPAFARAQDALRGHVVDATGAALGRVPVRLVDEAGITRASALSDAMGAFVFAASCDTCRVVASLPGFVTASVTPAAGVDTRIVLAVAPVRESVIVTATRDAAPSSQVAASVTVFDAAAIARRGDAPVGDLLRQAPGVAVVQHGGRGNVTSLFVRGGESSYTKVLLDGIPLNEPGGSFNFGGLSSGHFERIELVRGAQSALFGSDAMAGVLQLVTARGAQGPRPTMSAEVSAGEYGSARGHATVSGGARGWDYSVHGSRYDTDNRAPNNRFTSSTVSASAGGALSASLTLRGVVRYEDGRAGAPGQTAFGRPDMDAFFTQGHLVAGAVLEHQTSSRWKQRVTYALATSDQASTNLLFDAPYTPSYQGRTSPFQFFDFTYDTASEFRRHHAGYQGDLRLTRGGALAGAEFFTVAFDWDGERGTLRDRMAGTSISPSRNNAGATVQHQHVSARLAITTGVRLERNASFGTAVVPRVSAAVLLRTGNDTLGATKVKGNAGKGIKEPTLRQSFSLSPFDLGNPDLDAERSRTADVGVEQRFFGDRAKVEVVWFDNRFERQVSTRTVSFSPYQARYFNVGLTRARGTEVVAEVAPRAGLRIIASHTFVDSEIVDSSSEFSEALAAGQWALRRPRHSGHVQALFDRGRLSWDLAGTFLGRRNDSDFSSLVPAITSAEGHALWRAQAAVRITTQATAFVRVENLTDVDYMEPLGYPAWRRTVHAGVRLKF